MIVTYLDVLLLGLIAPTFVAFLNWRDARRQHRGQGEAFRRYRDATHAELRRNLERT